MLTTEQIITDLETKVLQLKSDKKKVEHFVSAVAILKEIEDLERDIRLLKEELN